MGFRDAIGRLLPRRQAEPKIEIAADEPVLPDRELTLEDEATVMPGNLSYANWLDLAAQRGVELDQLAEWTALPPENRPLSPEAEAARDAREEAYVERQLAQAYEADAQVEAIDEAAIAAMNAQPAQQVTGFEFDDELLYAVRHDDGGFQILDERELHAERELGNAPPDGAQLQRQRQAGIELGPF